MKQISVMYENFWKGNEVRAKYSFFAVLILAIVLSSCSLNQVQSSEKTRPVIPTTQTESPTVIINTPTTSSTPVPIKTPTEIKISSYRQIDKSFNSLLPVINSTQGPVSIKSTQPTTDEFLYKNDIVTVFLGDDIDVLAYLNLDDLNNNGMGNSDIAIEYTGQSYKWYLLLPINGAVYYYSDNKFMDALSCLKHFPISGMDDLKYTYQGMDFDTSSGSFCVITNEDRMAVVQFKENSIIYNDDYTQNLSFIVTVYSEILK